MSVDVGQETEQLGAFHVILIIAVAVKHDMEIIDDRIAAALDHTDQTVDRVVQPQILPSARFVYILDRHRISQLVVGQQITVPVQNVAPGRGYGALSCDPQLKIVEVFFSVDDLQLEKGIDQITAHTE